MTDTSNNFKSLLRMVESRFGRSPKTPGDFNELLLSIQTRTGQNLSLSTIKRLWGYVSYPHIPYLSTLTILSQYVGFQDWESFCEFPKSDDSSFIADYYDFNNMKPGVVITLQWDTGKGCSLKHLLNNRFTVIEAHNIKLQKGDELTVEFFSIGQPIYMKNIIRQGKKIPIYIAAKKSGLKIIRLEA